MKELYEEKLKVVLNLVRPNLQPNDAMHVTQAIDNMIRAGVNAGYIQIPDTSPESKTAKKQGASAS